MNTIQDFNDLFTSQVGWHREPLFKVMMRENNFRTAIESILINEVITCNDVMDFPHDVNNDVSK